MSNRTRLFGEPLKRKNKKEKFNLDISSDMSGTLKGITTYNNSLPSPAEFIEDIRIKQDISRESAFSLTAPSKLEKGWAFPVNYVAVHEVAVLVNAAVGATTVAGAVTLVAAALGVIPGEEKEKQFYNELNKKFLSQLSSEAFRIGGFPYLNEVVKEFTLSVKEYNKKGGVYGV